MHADDRVAHARITRSGLVLGLAGLLIASVGVSPTYAAQALGTSASAGGPTTVKGHLTFSGTLDTGRQDEPEVILEDETGFVTRNPNFQISEASQVMGQFTSDLNVSPVSYRLNLPAAPHGHLNDVNHNGRHDRGVQVFAVTAWNNIWGNSYLEPRDQYGMAWSAFVASTRVDSYSDEYTGGKVLVFAPDASQQFPSGFGHDGKLFTHDDPLMSVTKGWSVIDMDTTPFSVDRSSTAVMDLYLPPSASVVDFSGLSYTAAFDAMLDKFRHEYAWTDLKHIDWDAEAARFRPEFVQAQAHSDPHAYALAMRDFLWSIPDSHIAFDNSLLYDDFVTQTAGGLGFAMTRTDDGRYLVDYVTPDGPAARAGIRFGAEIAALHGQPVAQAVAADVPWSSPFSTKLGERLQQERYALRFPLSRGHVEVGYRNPGAGAESANLPVVQEGDSFTHSSINYGVSATALPVEFHILPSGIAVIQLNSFADNTVLTIHLWERAIQYLNDYGVPAVVIDARHNDGGDIWLADQMAAYFRTHRISVGNIRNYDPETDRFSADPNTRYVMIPPPAGLQYHGKVAVLVGPACFSSCEFFSYDMSLGGRASIVGQYPSAGAGGSTNYFFMPEGIFVEYTVGQVLDGSGKPELEGKGVHPTLRVPVNLQTLRATANGADPVLNAAVKLLGNELGR